MQWAPSPQPECFGWDTVVRGLQKTRPMARVAVPTGRIDTGDQHCKPAATQADGRRAEKRGQVNTTLTFEVNPKDSKRSWQRLPHCTRGVASQVLLGSGNGLALSSTQQIPTDGRSEALVSPSCSQASGLNGKQSLRKSNFPSRCPPGCRLQPAQKRSLLRDQRIKRESG